MVAAACGGECGECSRIRKAAARCGRNLTAMDPRVKPGDDFNRYASGAWLARTEIPSDKPMASLRFLMSDRTEERLHGLMEKAANTASAQPSTLDGKIGAFYRSFMGEAKIDQLGVGPIAGELNAIRNSHDRQDIAELMGRNNSDFYATTFVLGTDVDLKDVSRYALYANQGGLGLPDRDYYLQASFAAQKAAYQSYVEKLLALIGWPEPKVNAAAVVALETRRRGVDQGAAARNRESLQSHRIERPGKFHARIPVEGFPKRSRSREDRPSDYCGEIRLRAYRCDLPSDSIGCTQGLAGIQRRRQCRVLSSEGLHRCTIPIPQ